MAFGQVLGAMAGAQGPLASAVQPQPKLNWLGVLADALSGAAGQTPLYTHSLMLQKQMQLQQQMLQGTSDRELQRQKDLYSFELQNPKPDQPSEYERALTAAGILPGTPDYIAHMNKYIGMKESPTWTYTDPTTGALMMGTKSPPQPEIISALPPGAKPIGGQTPPASGSFPKPKRK